MGKISLQLTIGGKPNLSLNNIGKNQVYESVQTSTFFFHSVSVRKERHSRRISPALDKKLLVEACYSFFLDQNESRLGIEVANAVFQNGEYSCALHNKMASSFQDSKKTIVKDFTTIELCGGHYFDVT